ncbi:MAG: TetR/AcrR family transcriptional regulator [Xanthomonadales bacterium]|jgi:AcrR family transcriptional regulator|nr:TetR/AcrR family transcriptional regulator [Xanthomonadales bacterium]
MARRSDHSREELREMALTAAEKIVVEQGYEGLSARKVAAQIGYTVGTLYLVFENIDDLILQINARTLDRLHARMTQPHANSIDPRDYLVQLGQAYIRFADEDPHRWAMVFEHRLAEDRSLPAWYQEKVARMFAMVEQGLQPLAGRHSQDDVLQASRALWGGVHGICILALSDNLGVAGVDSVQQLTESLIRNYLKGFTGD